MSAKLCKDCRWYKAEWKFSRPDCTHHLRSPRRLVMAMEAVYLPRVQFAAHDDMVVDPPTPFYRTEKWLSCAHTSRDRYGSCGPEGKLWEPRRTLWRRMKGWWIR